MKLQGAREIITELLSTNSRISISDLSRISGVSRPSTSKILKSLTKELGLKFVLELDEAKLGYPIMHNVIVKFEKRPDLGKIESTINKDNRINFACSCHGDFDIMLQALSKTSTEYFDWENSFIDQICEYRPKLMASEIAKVRFGFFPVGNDLVAASQLNEEDKALVAELNANSRTGINELEQKTGINGETIRYRMKKLAEDGVIKRFTIASQKPVQDYAIVYLSNYIFNSKTRYKASLRRYDYFDADKSGILNAFQNISLLSGSYKFLGIGIFKDKKEAVESTVEKHIRAFGEDNVSVVSARILKALKGIMPFRKPNIKRNYIQ